MGRLHGREAAYPNHRMTPGALNPVVTPETVGQAICRRGWTRTVRPSAQISHQMKRQAIAEYGLRGQHLSNYEGDRLVPLALGGAPADTRNYWPEPVFAADG